MRFERSWQLTSANAARVIDCFSVFHGQDHLRSNHDTMVYACVEDLLQVIARRRRAGRHEPDVLTHLSDDKVVVLLEGASGGDHSVRKAGWSEARWFKL